jgi:hypothetical protein
VTGAEVRYPWALTKAVLAIVVEESAVRAVGTVGVPVKAGDAKGAYDARDEVVTYPEMLAPEGIVTVPVKVGLAIGA